jgi:hypothetical protein
MRLSVSNSYGHLLASPSQHGSAARYLFEGAHRFPATFVFQFDFGLFHLGLPVPAACREVYAIAYFQEENDTDFLAISGELKVTPGRRIEVEFPNGKPSKKKNGEHLFVLKDLQSNDRGIHVTMDLPQLGKKRGNQFGNAQAMMKALLEQQGAFEVWIQDSEGVLHAPGASGSAGGSSSASGSGGGGGNGRGSFGQDAQSLSTQAFTFGGLPSGREIQAVIVRATEKTGKPQSYPFKLQKVPVPYGVN